MGLGSFVGEGGTHRHLVWVRYMRESGRVERQRRRMFDRMLAVVNKQHPDQWPDEVFLTVLGRIHAAQDRVFPFPSYEDCEGLPWPVWIAEPLTCQGCGTVSAFQKGHIEGATIGKCSSCPGGLPHLGSSRKKSA